MDDIRRSVVAVSSENVPILVDHVATVQLGPSSRRGALDKGGASVVGGVVVARYGDNPLAVINAVKQKIAETQNSMPEKVLFNTSLATEQEIERYADKFTLPLAPQNDLEHQQWTAHLRSIDHSSRPEWATISQVQVIPFYDRTGLIYETLGTLNDAIALQILVTIIVVLLLVSHFRSSLLISAMMPLAVLLCFIAMKLCNIQANIVALSGIVIAIGTIVDVGIVVCENILRHLSKADKRESSLQIVHRATSEVGGAVLTAVMTTIVSFLPVFTMIGAEGKLFKPLAYTKTFALAASIAIALTVIPAAAHTLFCGKFAWKRIKSLLFLLLVTGAVVAAFTSLSIAIAILAAGGVMLYLAQRVLSARSSRVVPSRQEAGPDHVRLTSFLNIVVICIVTLTLSNYWEPLGPAKGTLRNVLFVTVMIGSLLLLFFLFRHFYERLLRWCLAHKFTFLAIPFVIVVCGLLSWLGPGRFFGPLSKAPSESQIGTPSSLQKAIHNGMLEHRGKWLCWTTAALSLDQETLSQSLKEAGIDLDPSLLSNWQKSVKWMKTRQRSWMQVQSSSLLERLRWTLTTSWDGLGKEFMPSLDEGSFLWMPTTMTHASIGEALDVLQTQDKAFDAIPEIDSVIGKLGRADTPLDPAPISMIETIINYKPEYRTDEKGRRINYRFDSKTQSFARDQYGELIPDKRGRPFRQWRDHIHSPDDIWSEIIKAAKLPGTTSAPKLQPIAARIIMLQSGMRAPMGVKVKGPNLETIESVGLQIEKLLKQVRSVESSAVIADRMVGKPYIEIHPDRDALARYGIPIRKFQDMVEIAIGGKTIMHTVEGRERFPVRVRYQREQRDSLDALNEILVAGQGGQQIPLQQLADIHYVRGPQVIKSEDTFLVGYVVFDMKPGFAEGDVVEECQRYLQAKQESGDLTIPRGVSYEFAGNYENTIRATQKLAVIMPLALFIIFMLIYFQFKRLSHTLLVFSGIFVAWSGGFILIWLYGQPWFMDFSAFGMDMRNLFQIHTINMSVAVWVGFLALFGIATDDGVIIMTYISQRLRDKPPRTKEDIHEAIIKAGVRRVRPCLMTSATTILALLPVLTSSGRGSDVMVPMAIPSFGGMCVVLISIFMVPVLSAIVEERRLLRLGPIGQLTEQPFDSSGEA
jgi:Cu(I)/Ag(I) efflux system membrane protein CusA/SilA